MLEKLLSPWPWYIVGPLIGLSIPLLAVFVGKPLGISSSLRNMCKIALPQSKLDYIKSVNLKAETWNLIFVLGLILGGFLGAQVLSNQSFSYLPEAFFHWTGWWKLILGGVLVGFGTRYANGCTSGHSIMGLSNLQWTSLVASVFFFLGGLLMTLLDVSFGGWL